MSSAKGHLQRLNRPIHQPTAVPHRFLHDPLRRQIHTIDPRTGTSTVHYAATGEIDYTEDAAGHRTTTAYDPAGNQTATTDPGSGTGNTTRRHYSPRGQLLAEWDATYPVRHQYDIYGQKTGLYTLRDTNVVINSYQDFLTAEPVMDKTTWYYDPDHGSGPSVGHLTFKEYADGNGPTYPTIPTEHSTPAPGPAASSPPTATPPAPASSTPPNTPTTPPTSPTSTTPPPAS